MSMIAIPFAVDIEKVKAVFGCKDRELLEKIKTAGLYDNYASQDDDFPDPKYQYDFREGREWRRFSIMDAVWVKLLKELREFGMSREQLKTTKQSLEFESENCGVAMPLLEFYTAFAIATKMPVLVLVFKDGLAVPANFTQYKIAQQVQGMENRIQLSLNDILQGFFPDVDLKAKYKNELPMSVNEMELLAYLRIANFERITVKFNNGQMEKFEGVQRLKAKKRIEELIREHSYQDIQLQEEDGEVTAIFQTIKKKFTKGSNPK